MAGLLDTQQSGGLLGALFDDPGARLGLGLLAASSPKLRGLGQVMAQQDQAKQQALQQQYIQSQIAENATQNKQREMQMKAAMDKQAWEQAYYMGGQMPGAQGAGYISSGGSGATPAASSGQMATGATAPTPSEGKFDEWSRSYGIPKDALVADWKSNGGKGIAEMLMKRGAPDMQVTNGYAYDKNRLGAGFMPSLSTSQDGKTSMVRIGPDGLPVVMAPQGAMETFAGYQGAQAAFKPIKVYNPATGREEYTNEGAVVRPQGVPSAQPQYSGPGYAGGSAANAAQGQLQIMQSEYNRLPEGHPDRPAIMREMQRLGGGQATPQSGNYAAGPSAAEAAANEARRVQAVEQVKADILPTSTKLAAVDKTKDALGVLQQALNHPGLKTATGLQGSIDPRNYIPGTDATNFRVLMDQIKGSVFLDAYKDLQGGGAITNVEGDKAEAAKARINRAQSPDEFVKGLNEYKAILERGYERAQQRAGNQGGATGGWEDRQSQQAPAQQREFSMLPNATQYDGKRMRAPDGTIYRSSGGRWTKE